MKSFSTYKQTLMPPYTRRDLPAILITLFFLLLIPVIILFLSQTTVDRGRASSAASLEPESGVLDSNVIARNDDPTISGGYVTFGGVSIPCQTGNATSWTNTSFPDQTGIFTVTFDTTPSTTDANTGLSATTATAYTQLAAAVRFINGTIDVRNGGAFASLTPYPYTNGQTYRIRMVVDVPNKTYSVFVKGPTDQAEVQLANNYAFRTEAADTTSIANLALFAQNGSHTACNGVMLGGGSVTSPSTVPPTTAPTAVPTTVPTGTLGSCDSYPHTSTVNVNTVALLTTAIANAVPGVLIKIANGNYATTSDFKITRDGTAANPIIVCGTRQAVFNRGTQTGGTVFMFDDADYVQLIGVTLTNSQKGVVMEHTEYSVIKNVEIYNLGQEAIGVHYFSNHNLIEGNYVHDTGKVNAGFGEGVYIGSALNKLAACCNNQPDDTAYNTIQNNILGPNITAEPLDVKGGSHDNLILANTIDGRGRDTAVGIDGFADIQGYNNTFNDNKYNVDLTYVSEVYGFVLNVTSGQSAVSGKGNTFRRNRIRLNRTDGIGIVNYISAANGGPTNLIYCDNVAINTGRMTNVTCKN